jgi:SAM-dependent methyltransferase
MREEEYHRQYFSGAGRHVRIAPGQTLCVRRHVANTLDPLRLAPGARVLELGCGLGRFTEPMLERGYHVTALDLSEALVDGLRARFGGSGRLTTVAGPAEDLASLAPGPFDAVVGFFFLHHLTDLAPIFDGIARVLTPGGSVAFCEPNAFNPLVYVQVTFTPGMSWKGEPAIPKMRPGVIFPLLRERGFTRIASSRYGMLPPLVSNTGPGARIERALEWIPPLRPLSAYRTFHATAPGNESGSPTR